MPVFCWQEPGLQAYRLPHEGTCNQPLQQLRKSLGVLSLGSRVGKLPEMFPKLSSQLLVLFVLLFLHHGGRSPGLRTREILCLGRQNLLPDQDQTMESQPGSLEYRTVF